MHFSCRISLVSFVMLLVDQLNIEYRTENSKEVHSTFECVKGKVMVSIGTNVSHFVLVKSAVDFIRCKD